MEEALEGWQGGWGGGSIDLLGAGGGNYTASQYLSIIRVTVKPISIRNITY